MDCQSVFIFPGECVPMADRIAKWKQHFKEGIGLVKSWEKRNSVLKAV